MEKTAGIAGLGIMGGAIARNLSARGWKIIGFDIDNKKCESLKASGVEIASSAAEIAQRTPIIMTSLLSPQAASAVAAKSPAAAPAGGSYARPRRQAQLRRYPPGGRSHSPGLPGQRDFGTG